MLPGNAIEIAVEWSSLLPIFQAMGEGYEMEQD
jgi:hypothetical protein